MSICEFCETEIEDDETCCDEATLIKLGEAAKLLFACVKSRQSDCCGLANPCLACREDIKAMAAYVEAS